MLGERVRQVRELEGWTQEELGSRSGIGQSAIAQIEAGIFLPSETVLASIALATGYEVMFFKQGAPAHFPLGAFLYRAQAKVSAKDRTKIHRFTQLMFESVTKMLSHLKPIPMLVPRTSDGPVSAANLARASMAFSPNTPVANLTAAIERLGIFVLPIKADIPGFDGFSAWVGLNANTPVMGIKLGGIGYRQRFTLAEELGHLIMHSPLRVEPKKADEEARLFAGELLLPAQAFRLELPRPLTLAGLSSMKHRWKTSYQFILRRAKDLHLISDNQYRYLQMQISSRKWRLSEPGDEQIVQEEPLAFQQMLKLVYGERIDEKQLQRDLGGIPTGLVRRLLPKIDDERGRLLTFGKS